MAVEIRLTFGKDGLKITQHIDSEIPFSGDQNPIEAKRLKKHYVAGEAAKSAAMPTSPEIGGKFGGGGFPRKPTGPIGGGGFSVPSAGGTVTLIGPIIIATCDCLHHDEKHEGREQNKNG
jgi:hypothetical protein